MHVERDPKVWKSEAEFKASGLYKRYLPIEMQANIAPRWYQKDWFQDLCGMVSLFLFLSAVVWFGDMLS